MNDESRARRGPDPDIILNTVSITCPDCARRSHGRHLQHEASCPLGRAVDKRVAKDRRWFEQRPGTLTRRRPVHRTEVAELRLWNRPPAR